MKTTLLRALVVAGCLFAGAFPVRAQAPATSASPPGKAAPVPNQPASPPPAAAPATPAAGTNPANAPRPSANAATAQPTAPATPKAAGVGQMTREFGEQSKDVLEKRNALIERLRLAKTDDERERIIAEIRQQQKQRLDQQREIARQIREQMQTSRKETLPAGTGR